MSSGKPRKYFGTDGIRGKANKTLTPALALLVGQAAGILFRNGGLRRHTVIIGKDTRRSCYMIENALTAGFLSAGMDVELTGPMPTPGIAMLTRAKRADLGVMISASHNPFEDNGIKLFGPDGFKLTDETELKIEELMGSDIAHMLAEGEHIGRADRVEGVSARYAQFAQGALPKDITFDGLRVVIDCAHGAAYKLAPQVLAELGAEVIAIGVEPNGSNINAGCGSTSPQALQHKVKEVRADFGIALDGDADRVICTDEHSRIIDGDQILAIIAEHWQSEGQLINPVVVGTIMSNLGMERYLKTLGITLERAQVGDRYVLEAMRKHASVLGAEPSGHVIMSDYGSTGDGLVAALQVLAVMKKKGVKASEVAHRFDHLPQIHRSVPDRGDGKKLLATPEIQEAIRVGTEELGDEGRLVIRPSGTEPIVRVMGEGDDAELVTRVVEQIAATMEA